MLVRHGEARAGVERVIGGDHGCLGLTDRGRGEAAALRDRLAATGEIAPDVIYTSTLRRAVETAEIVHEAFPHVESIRPARDLREQDPGVCDGMHYLDAVAQYAPEVDGPDAPLSPGGESAREFDRRVRAAMDRLVREHPAQTLLVVSHGGFISAACMYVLAAPGLAAVYPFRLAPANTSLTTVVPGASRPPWLMERYNDTAHLGPRQPVTRRS